MAGASLGNLDGFERRAKITHICCVTDRVLKSGVGLPLASENEAGAVRCSKAVARAAGCKLFNV